MSWTPYKTPGGHVILEAQAAITKGDPVKLVTNGINVAGDGDTIYGVAAVDIASGATGGVWTEGIFEVPAAAALTMGQLVACAASGQVDGGTTADKVAGVVVEKDVANGATARIELHSQSANAIP